MPDPPQTDDPLDEAFAAYLRSCDTGEIKSREDFLAQFPELADELKQLMEAADMIGSFTDQSSGSPVSQAGKNPADTIITSKASESDPDYDPAVTLPIANRRKGDPGPTLPYDLGGTYLLQEELGRGGMGVVYLAKQRELNRFVAVKMIRSGMLAGNNEVRRFYIEAQATARLSHPGIVSIHHFGQHEGHHFFSMEYIRGTDLQRKITGEQLSPKQAAQYVRDVAIAIHHAHQKGVLHRDLKPANVLIDEQDRVHVTDFGLAKHMDADSSVTGSGAAVGTPHYMSPEQAGGHSERVCRQSDVYSLGAILFACVTGRPPIVADTVMQTLVQVIHDPAPSARSVRGDIPVDLETIIAKCLEKQPGKRYESAEELAEELNAFLEERPIRARPRSRVVKAWHWFEGVPVVAALMGRRVLHSSATHRRFQTAMLLLLFLLTPIMVAGFFTMVSYYRNVLPDTVRIAGGVDGGLYNGLSQELLDRIAQSHDIEQSLKQTGGSIDNLEALLSDEVDLAPMQATAIRGDRLCVVAPLFDEVLYVLARTDSKIQTIRDLNGQLVAVGPKGSGSQATANLVLESLDLQDSVEQLSIEWRQLSDAPETLDVQPDAAMVCIGSGSEIVNKLFHSGDWRIVPIFEGVQIRRRHPTLEVMTIEPWEFPEGSRPDSGIPTVGTTAFLAAKKNAPSSLVRAALDALYADPPLLESLIPKAGAAEWQDLGFHDEARRYFTEYVRAQSAESH
ncbi:MAG: serine/threonine-protein kinase [Planctomycetota bacterium]